MMSYEYPHPVSRTYQYKKITKPLLERKRRARINRCLDELKDLMVDAFETEGENISKLEKADILELTVRHLQRLHSARPSGLSGSSLVSEQTTPDGRWKSGFGHCAAEACRFLSALPGETAERLAKHLADGLQTSQSIGTPSLLSPSLANLEQVANSVSQCSTNSIDAGAPKSDKISTSRLAPYPKKCTASRNVGTQSTSTDDIQQALSLVMGNFAKQRVLAASRENFLNNNEDPVEKNENEGNVEEEEIDVERVEMHNDPMWRPW